MIAELNFSLCNETPHRRRFTHPSALFFVFVFLNLILNFLPNSTIVLFYLMTYFQVIQKKKNKNQTWQAQRFVREGKG